MPKITAHILVIDDEPGMCWAFENFLSQVGYMVTIALSGASALELITEGVFAAALVDAKLPDLDGLKLAELIRQKDPEIAVILVSGYFYEQDSEIVAAIQRNTIFGFVAKPFSLNHVHTMIQQAMERAEKVGD